MPSLPSMPSLLDIQECPGMSPRLLDQLWTSLNIIQKRQGHGYFHMILNAKLIFVMKNNMDHVVDVIKLFVKSITNFSHMHAAAR